MLGQETDDRQLTLEKMKTESSKFIFFSTTSDNFKKIYMSMNGLERDI